MKFSLEKIKNNIKKDNGVKFIAFVFAVLIWLFVTISLYPDTTITVNNIPVTINVDDTYVNEMGLNVVSGEGQTVTAKIKGNRSHIGRLKADDFNAVVSLDGIQTAAEYELSVVVSPKNPNIECEIVSVNPSKIKVKFDNVVSKAFTLETQTSAIIPDGYMMGTLESSPKTIKITGPEQEINKIDTCVAFVAPGTLTETQSISANIILYDAEKNVLDKSVFAFSTTDVSVTIPVYEKKAIPFEVSFRNVPKGFDLELLEYKLSEETIEIAATSEVVSKFESLSLSYIDFRAIELGSTFTIAVEVPSGVQNISGIETVEVSFPTEGCISKTFSVPNINVLNAPTDFDIKLLTTRLPKVTVNGPASTINSLTVNDIVAEIDLSTVAIADGTQTVAVNVYAPSKGAVWANGIYSASITATPKNVE